MPTIISEASHAVGHDRADDEELLVATRLIEDEIANEVERIRLNVGRVLKDGGLMIGGGGGSNLPQ